jgi:ABC-type lipoprotein release transport system permease subunit
VPILLVISWRNLLRGWRRSVLVAAAIAFGLSGSLALVGWSRGMVHQMAENAIRTRLGHVVVHARGYHQDPDLRRAIPDDARAVLAALAGRAGVHASPRLVGEGLVQSARASLPAEIIGVLPDREERVSVIAGGVVEGAWLDGAAAGPARALPPILIGRSAAERLRTGVGDKLVLHVAGEAGLGAFRVRGIYQTDSSEFDRSVAYVRLADAQRLLGAAGQVTEVAVALERPAAAQELQRELVAALDGQPLDVLRWQEREPRLSAMLDQINSVGWIFYGVVFVAMAFGIANALLMSVYERTREFGVLRALGLPARRLVALVMLESALLTLSGSALGLGIGAGGVAWLGARGLDLAIFSAALRQFSVGTTIYPRIGAADVLSPLVLALVTAGVAALWPALRLVRLRPAQALRRT